MELRILPMSHDDEEFVGKTIEEIQKDFFEDYLNGDGWYQYGKSGLDSQEGDIVLFQMDNQIIASAIFDFPIRYKKSQNGYNGSLLFKKNTVKTFKPISKEELSTIIYTFTSFNQAKPKYSEKEVNYELLNERMK